MTVSTHEIETDPNVVAYNEYLSDEAWVEQNSGMYVCFVNGVLAGVDAQETALLEKMRAEHAGSPRFFSQVGGEDRVIPIPSLLHVEEE